MKDGKPRLVSIDNEATGEHKAGVVSYTMTYHSGGLVDVYIELVLPKPHLMIMGESHIAMELSKLGKTMGYKVSVVAGNIDQEGFADADEHFTFQNIDKESVRPNTYMVVSTQREGDEIALEKVIKREASYVAFVASRRKANAIFHELRARGITMDQLKKLKMPAGLNIQAKLPEEVAISILAQIIEHIRKLAKVSETKNEKAKLKYQRCQKISLLTQFAKCLFIKQ